MLQHRAVLEKNSKFRQRLNEVLPLDDGQLKDVSLLNGAPISHIESRIFVGDEDLDGAIMQVERLKGYINKLELQIYEMNEKVSELIENVRMRIHRPSSDKQTAIKLHHSFSLLQTQQLERENKSLKVESESMNSVAKMVTDNMKESIETNKR